jgi:hypothetical protein
MLLLMSGALLSPTAQPRMHRFTIFFPLLLIAASASDAQWMRPRKQTPALVVRMYYEILRDAEPGTIDLFDFIQADALEAFKRRVLNALSHADTNDSELHRKLMQLTRGTSIEKLRVMSAPHFTNLIAEGSYESELCMGVWHGWVAHVMGDLVSDSENAYVVVDIVKEDIRIDWPASSALALHLVKSGSAWKIEYPTELDQLASLIESDLNPARPADR